MHTIRLRGPWEFRVFADYSRPDASDTDLPSGKIQMPTGWGASLWHDFRGRVRFTRRFNQPTGLDNTEQVRLCVAAVNGLAIISLNDQVLAQVVDEGNDQRFDVLQLLRPTNQLVITVDSSGAHDSAGRDHVVRRPIGEVWLEILER